VSVIEAFIIHKGTRCVHFPVEPKPPTPLRVQNLSWPRTTTGVQEQKPTSQSQEAHQFQALQASRCAPGSVAPRDRHAKLRDNMAQRPQLLSEQQNVEGSCDTFEIVRAVVEQNYADVSSIVFVCARSAGHGFRAPYDKSDCLPITPAPTSMKFFQAKPERGAAAEGATLSGTNTPQGNTN
jgi:hypothetical protein